MPHAALVTGAATRIGAAIARRLAQSGLRVAIHYRGSAAEAEALAGEIGGAAATVKADLEDRADRAALIARAAEAVGPLTVLVNNASLFDPDSVETLDEALWDRHMALHAEAPAFLTRDFAAQLPAGAEGNVVNIIDERVWRLAPAFFSYTLSKSALWTATRTMAQSLAPRIRVNAIGPGPVLPHPRQSQADFDASVARLPLQRSARPEDIAEAVTFILGCKSLTGQMLALDGGEHLAWPEGRGVTPRQP